MALPTRKRKDGRAAAHGADRAGADDAPPGRLPGREGPGGRAGGGARRGGARFGGWITVTVFLLPAMLLFALLVLVPIGVALYTSLFRWGGFGPPENFVG